MSNTVSPAPAKTLPRTPEEFRRKLRGHHGQIFGPPQFTDWADEERSWKETCYIGNWSRAVPSLKYTGPDVLRLFADCSVNSMTNFKIGQSKHIIHCNDDGKLIEEGILTRTGEQELVAYSTFWADYCRRKGDYDVEMEFLQWDSYHVQGPNSLFVLEKVTGRDLRHMKYMHNEAVLIDGVEVRVLRQGMSGEIGFELQVSSEEGPKVWAAVVEAGQEYGIREMGGRVAMLNHLQAGYPTYVLDYLPAIFGDDFAEYLAEFNETAADLHDYYWATAGSFESDKLSDWYRSPIELGWANRINFDHKFRGDEALKRELAAPKRTICTLRWNAEDVVDIYASYFRKGGELPDFMEMPTDPRGYLYFDKVLKDGKEIGATSSRGYSAHFREMISHAVIDLEFAEPGTEVTVIWGNPGTEQREIRAVTAPTPYKEVRSRVDLNTLPRR